MGEKSKELTSVAIDPDDEIFIACALIAGATVLVSGDAHLLNVKQYEKIKIMTPVDFLTSQNGIRP